MTRDTIKLSFGHLWKPIIREILGLALLSQVSQKVGMLSGAGGSHFDKDREERARDMYQTYISEYKSKLKYGNETEMSGE